MHAYDLPQRPSYASMSSGRYGPDSSGGFSATPIFDALYAEYGKSFRTLPGDRSGEEELGFTAFGTLPRGSGSFGGSFGNSFSSSFSSSYSAYSAGASSARSGGEQQSQWQRVGEVGTYGTMHHIPAALPPAPRRGV
ncbi:hypothetical protein ACIQNG_23185 [Streptomyces sp. NPDC091377]|uniref:hypothetical protein n=1 Tax=Streptomyces sp. NPDC091377 TaxID=3365995 RepID=UPI00382333C0